MDSRYNYVNIDTFGEIMHISAMTVIPEMPCYDYKVRDSDYTAMEHNGDMCQTCNSLVQHNKHENYIKHMHKLRLKTMTGEPHWNVMSSRQAQGHITSRTLHRKLNISTVLLALFYIITLLPMTTGQLSWKTRPEDTSVRENEGASVVCEVNNLGGLSMEWRQYLDGGGDYTFFINDTRHDAPDRFSVSSNGYGYTLQVSGATREDDAEYQCGVATWNEKVRARLTVLVEPAVPVITLNVSDTDLQENDYVKFTCSSSEGNPPPNFTWLRDDEEEEQTQYIPPPDKFGESQSVLIWQLSREDHQVLVNCQVENEANLGNPVITGKLLNVKYAPVLDLGPYDPYKVVLSNTETLTCNTDANPSVSEIGVQWYKDSIFIETGSSLTISNILKGDAGIYTCEASNGVGQAQSRDLMLDVLYGPEITLHYSDGDRDIEGSEVRIEEGHAVNITCMTDSNPTVTSDSIEWRKAGVSFKTGPSLYIASVQRSDAGSYSCVASNTLIPSDGQEQTQQDEEFFFLRVLYAPGSASITVPDLVVKGEAASMICIVDDRGDPPGSLIWTRLGESTVLSNNTSLDILSVQLSDHGEYVCTPQNTIGPGQADIQLLDVQERPEWLEHTLPPSKMVDLNSTLQVTCQARGKPLPTITWYLGGTIIYPSDGWFTVTENQQPIEQHSWNVTSILKWEGANRTPSTTSLSHADAGNYTCHVSNELSSIATSMNLLVQYPPNVVPSSEKVAIDRNQSASMACLSHGYPETIYEWYNDTVKIVPGGRIRIQDDEIGGEYPYRSQLVISDVSSVDLGEYHCRGCNYMGCNAALIFLTVKDKPDRPTDLQVQSKTWESVSVHWTQGFDGGYPQEFYVTYSYRDNNNNPQQGVVEAGNTDNFNVTELLPSFNYTLSVFSVNSLGPSEPSLPVWALTDSFTITPPGRVEYDEEERLLVFTSPSSNYCARIEINNGSSWYIYEGCAPAEGSVQIKEGREVRDIRVALCLTRRQDVCSQMVYADFVGEDLPKETIIIVGCVCGGVVVILTIVLVVLCCKRHKAKPEQYEKQEASQMHPVISNNAAPAAEQETALKPALKAGVDNPGLDQTDQTRGSTRQPRDTVFVTETSVKPPAVSYGYDGRQNGRPNGHITHNPDISWDAPPPSYENHRNEELYNHKAQVSPVDRNTLYLDNPYPVEPRSRDLGSYSDSGVSTPDPQKPKKVIYEVIV